MKIALYLMFVLFAMHALLDYPLQGDFLSRGKNHKHPLPGVPWYQCLFAHALIQAAGVFVITHNSAVAFGEFIVHFATDYAKCAGFFGEGESAFNIDQTIHYVSKLLWIFLLYKGWV